MRRLWLPLLLFLATSLPHLDKGDFRRDTGLYAAVGHWMWESGQLATPHVHPEVPYFKKPPLAILIHGLSLQAGGRDNLVAARLPSVLAGGGVVVLSVLIASHLASGGLALTSGIVLALSYDFFRRTREISLDFWQLLFIMGAVYMTIRGLDAMGRGRWWFFSAGFSIGLALLCKPLIGLVTFPILAIWMVVDGKQRCLLPFLMWGAIGLLLAAAPWHLHMVSRFGDDFLSVYFGNQIADRMRGDHGSGPWWYYLQLLFNYKWPWILALLLGFSVAFRKRLTSENRRLFLLAVIWTAIVLPALSLFTDKQPNYALPLFPPLSWICAVGLHSIRSGWYVRWRDGGYAWLGIAAASLGLLAAVLPIGTRSGADPDWSGIVKAVREQGIPPSKVAGISLQLKEIGVFYVLTGEFPIVNRGSPSEAEIVRKRVFRNNHPILFEGERLILFRPD